MKKIVIAISTGLLFLSISYPLFAQEKSFSDVPEDYQFKSAIDYVKSQNIVSGYPDGTYQPDKILNRAEFTKIIIASRFPKTAINGCVSQEKYYKKQVFSDVDHKVWFETFVCMAKKQNIIGGYGDGSFKPTNTINFAEAAKIVTKSYGLKIEGEGKDPWYAPFINRLQGLNAIPDSLLNVKASTDRAIKQITRGEMADIVYRLRTVQDTVKDPDNSFTLRVPEVSQPAGLQLSSIKIEKLPEGQNPIQEVNGAPMIFYRLEPPGIQFPQSVPFELQIHLVSNTIPMVFFVSGDNVEMIKTPTIEIDPQTQIASLTADIAHFSGVAIAGESPLTFAMQEGPSQAIEDEPFTVGFTITWNKDQSKKYAYESGNVKIQYDGNWTLFGVTSHFSGAVISAKTDELSEEGVEEGLDNEAIDLYMDRDSEDPDAIIISDIDQFFHNETFECAVSGRNQRISYAFNIGWGYKIIRGKKETTVRRVSTIVLKSAPFKCITKEEDESYLGDMRCAGIEPAIDENQAILLPMIKPDEDVNCYFRSDVEHFFPEESNCEEEHFGPVDSKPLESLSFDRTPKKVIDPDPDGCHFGVVSQFLEGIIVLDPKNIEKKVKTAVLKTEPKEDWNSFEGNIGLEQFDDIQNIELENSCDLEDPFDLDGTPAKITIDKHAITILLSEKKEIPALKGKIAPNGLVYAADKTLGDPSAIFAGKIYRVDELVNLKGTIWLKGETCFANTFISIE